MKWLNMFLLSMSMILGMSCSSMSLAPINVDEEDKSNAKYSRDHNRHNWPIDVQGR